MRAHQQLFERQIQKPDRRTAAVVQAAAVRRVDADGACRRQQPRIGAAFGAVAVQHIGIGIARALRHMALRRNIAEAEWRLIGMRVSAERELPDSDAKAASARAPPVVESATMPT